MKRPRVSLGGRITAVFLLLVVVVAALAVGSRFLPWDLDPWTVFLTILAVAIPLGAWAIGYVVRPVTTVMRGLTDGISNFHDRDFSVRLAYRRSDELGELVELYNTVGEVLHEERRDLLQRELLLATALDRSPAATILVNHLGRIIYSNRESRRLFVGDAQLNGMRFSELVEGCPPEMRDILETRTDGLFSISVDDENETYHLSHRLFQINRRQHRLVLLRRLTGELGRQEAETWKKVIRVISHELNNALAPVSSLVHSAEIIARDPERAARAPEVFDTIRERLDYLKGFIEGYGRFARLPRPRKRQVAWAELVDGLTGKQSGGPSGSQLAEFPTLELVDDLPATPGWFDPEQMRQVLVNLVKNAVEASEGAAKVQLHIDASPETGAFIQVVDQGRGMDEDIMNKALLPFYSTKKTGTGLGLPLCREIVEAHEGKLSLKANPGGGLTVTCWLPGRE